MYFKSCGIASNGRVWVRDMRDQLHWFDRAVNADIVFPGVARALAQLKKGIASWAS
jgi:hypothetical protein